MDEHKLTEGLLKENSELKSELDDLKLILEAVTGHSDNLESDLLEKVKDTIADSEKRFRLITETIPVPILITMESDDSIVYANEPAGDLFGLPVESLLKRKATEFYNLSERQRLTDIFERQGYLKNQELQGISEDRKPFWVELSVQALEYNREQCLLSIWHNITKRRILENQLRQTQKLEAIGTLAGGIAHDFNNILTIIFGNLDLAKKRLSATDSKTGRNIDNALSAANRAKAMVMQILAFCSQKEQERKTFKISMVISEAAEMITTLITSNIEVDLRIETWSPIISGDPTQIHQVLVNLCSNAGHALREKGGIIRIILQEVNINDRDYMLIPRLRPGSYVRLTVSDNGPGMDKGILDRVFDPFFTTKSPGEGTGMGLSVVHGIIQSHGGAVSIESEPGMGTAFYCYFPVLDELENISESEIVQKTEDEGAERILFVDDEQGILDAYGEMLENLGYNVTTRASSEDALNLVRKQSDNFDLVITDNTMPNMSGKKLARMILQHRPDIPIILSTGSSDQIDKKELDKIGIKGFVIKPFTQHQIASLIREIIKTEKS